MSIEGENGREECFFFQEEKKMQRTRDKTGCNVNMGARTPSEMNLEGLLGNRW